jgi:predicted RecB family nuclease
LRIRNLCPPKAGVPSPQCTGKAPSWAGPDHLSRVANIRQSQIGRLEAAGITTMEQLAESTAGPPRGLALLPPPSPNDVFFEIETAHVS